jgi:hypothetical protein
MNRFHWHQAQDQVDTKCKSWWSEELLTSWWHSCGDERRSEEAKRSNVHFGGGGVARN